ncbi:MAG TPA: GAF domain-containing sensor histidine kinase [Ktedonobacterales bacterium]|nr:GAF domain-containing sensor histidine kinase [Ktedonobacterales bacterium]
MNSRDQDEVTHLRAELDALSRISRNISMRLEVQGVLETILQELGGFFGTERLGVAFRDATTGEMDWAAGAGISAAFLDTMEGAIPAAPWEEFARQPESVYVADTQHDIPYETICQAMSAERIRSFLAVPLLYLGQLVGVLLLAHEEPHAYSARDLAFAELLGGQIAVAMENARLHERTREVVAAEERARLARDLHDSVSQSLFSLTLTVQTAREHLTDNLPLVEQALTLADELARGAQAEMRMLLFELRSTALQQEGLAAALEKQAEVLRQRTGLKVEVQMEGSMRPAAEQEEALYRIVQEALTNVVKHAHASRAIVRLRMEKAGVEAEINDDGRGFVWRESLGTSYGLRTMRERAERLGGKLEIDTQLGSGTRVRAHLPAQGGSDGT